MNLTTQQKEAIAHLNEWKVGALFMDAGTGKTRVALNLVNAVDNIDSVLFIAPLRTIDNAKAETEKWGGFNKPCKFVGVESLGMSDRIFLETLNDVDNRTFVVVDESIKVKNFEAKRTKRVLQIGEKAQYKLILNGTPITRNLLDLWSQMEFLSPKILKMSLASFKNTFCRYTTITKRIGYYSTKKEYITGYENIDYLYSLIRNYVYECDLHLNIKTSEHRYNYIVDGNEREQYNFLKEKYLSDEMLEFRNNNIFLEMTSKMQHEYCCVQNKFDVLDLLFNGIINQSDTIIFCRFVKSREECERRYKSALVLSFQKESLGLNLQQYRNIVYFDKIWDYALMVQSGRRIYRTGQLNDCNYYHLDGNIGLDGLIDRCISKKIGMTEYFKKVTKKELEAVL